MEQCFEKKKKLKLVASCHSYVGFQVDETHWMKSLCILFVGGLLVEFDKQIYGFIKDWGLIRLYYQDIPEGKEYPVLYRRPEFGESNWVETVLRYAKRGFGTEETLLDWNQIAEQHGMLFLFLFFILNLFTFLQCKCNKVAVFFRLCSYWDLSSVTGPQFPRIHD